MSEQSPQENSQPQTPAQHERSIEERISKLLDPEPDNETQEKQEPQEAEAQTEDSEEQPEEKAEEKAEETKLPETEEVEIDGEKFKIPAKLKDHFLRQQDYTRKTQETAEVKKNAEAILQQASKVLELQKAQRPVLGRLHALEERIGQYEKVDWNALTAQDAAEAQKHFIAFQQAKDAKVKAEAELKELENQQAESVRAALTAKLEEGRKALASKIKGWNDDLGRKIMTETHKAYGAPVEVLSSITEPWAVEALHDAMQWRALKASNLTEKKAPPKAPTLKPQGSEARNPNQQAYDQDRRALKSAKTVTERNKAAERLISRKLG